MDSKTNERWYDHDLIVFIKGNGMTGAGRLKNYSLFYGFQDPGGIRVMGAEVGFSCSDYLQISGQLLEMGYEFFPAGAADPYDLIGVFI